MTNTSSPDDRFFYLEDFQPGQIYTSSSITVTEEAIIAFAKEYDPQDFHMDAEKAKNTALGGLAASGWHTACLSMRLMADMMPRMEGGLVGRSIEKVEWPRSVRPNDTLSCTAEILEVRPSASNPSRGVMRFKNTTRNQNGETVLQMETVVFVPRRKP